MKKPLLLITALAASSLVLAQEVGRVISATPIMEQVGVPRNLCSVEQVQVQQRNSGAGAVMGALAGGAMGNAVGNGSGRTVATMVGLMGGAILGDRIEGNAYPQVQNVQRCTTQTFYENRVVAYDVVYDYAGQRYQTQMPQDPGPTIRLNVSPVADSVMPAAPMRTMVIDEPVRIYQPAPMLVVSTARLSYDNRVFHQPVMMVQNEHRIERRVDRRDDRRDERRETWQDNPRDNRDGAHWRDGR